ESSCDWVNGSERRQLRTAFGCLLQLQNSLDTRSFTLKFARLQRLTKEKKIRNPISFPNIESKEAPYELPEGWEFVRLGDCGYVLGGGTPNKSDAACWDGTIPWIRPKNMKVDYIADSQDYVSETALDKSTVKLIPQNSLLMVVRGMILVHSFPTAITAATVTINQDMKALCPYVEDTTNYLLLATKGRKDDFLSLVERSSHGTCRLETSKLFSTVLALPPLAEQHRIVAKVDQLMALCDTLEQQIDAIAQKQTALLNAVTAQL
ncbi:MAG: restriction endonuclease subunit S, partial [Phormidesmis sp.]